MKVTLAQQVDLLLTHSVGCTAHFTQLAGIAALTGPQDAAEAVVAEYQKRRDVVVDGLNQIRGIKCQKPKGAFYAFPNIQAFGKTSQEIADLVLDQAGVALLPGSSFGKYGEGYLRISYANSIDNLQSGLEKIKSVLETLV